MPNQEPLISELFDLTGKVCVVTGGCGYLGSAMARALAEAGARVVITSRDEERASVSARALDYATEVQHLGIALDHMDRDSIEKGFERIIEHTGQIDVLINNGHEALANDWKDVTPEQFTRQLSNATGYFQLAKLVRDHAVQRGAPASIVMLGSMYGSVGSYPEAYEGIVSASPVAYHTLKGGIIQMTRHLAVYWAKDRVRVTCLSPGPFPHPQAPTDMVERLKARCPMDRMGQPHELKGAIVFLASDASSYFTGQNLTIDGGWTAW